MGRTSSARCPSGGICILCLKLLKSEEFLSSRSAVQMTLTSGRTCSLPPCGMYCFSLRKRPSFFLTSGSAVSTSLIKTVPPAASTSAPPVTPLAVSLPKIPPSPAWAGSSTTTNGPTTRGPVDCTERAKVSLPEPSGPSTSSGVCFAAARWACCFTFSIFLFLPTTILGASAFFSLRTSLCRLKNSSAPLTAAASPASLIGR